MAEADLRIQAVLGRGLAHIVQDTRAVRDRLRLGPRLERIAEREHVAVGADAGIAEQVPGAADAVAAFENDKRLGRAIGLKMIPRADAGKARADDQHVEMFSTPRDLRLRHAACAKAAGVRTLASYIRARVR